MAVELQLRRGTTAEHANFTGKLGEVTMDTTKKTLVLHDGITQGGKPLASSSPSSIDQDDSHRFVTDAEKANWGSKLGYAQAEEAKIMTGFARAGTISITHTVNDITVTPIQETLVYLHGEKHTLSMTLTIDLSHEFGGIFVAYDVSLNQLYKVDTPDLANDILVAWVYKNKADGIIWVAEANHLMSVSVEEQKARKANEGLTWLDGGNLSFILNDKNHIELDISAPIILKDGELNFEVTDAVTPTDDFEQRLTRAELPVLHIDAMKEIAQTFNNGPENFLSDGTRAQFNQVDGTGVGQLITAGNNTYLAYWLVLTTDKLKPVKLVLGRDAHATLAGAESEEFAMYDLPMEEIKVINKIILHTHDDYSANAAKVVIKKVYKVEEKRHFSIKYHNDLAHRNQSDAHTIESITGLRVELDALSGGAGDIELSDKPVLGVIWNQTDDTYLRISKDVNNTRIQGYGEFSTWKTNSSDRQNDNDVGVASPLTKWLDTTENLPFSSMKRIVINTAGAEVKEYKADSYAHDDQVNLTATEQVMVKIPEFHYIDVNVVSQGKTYNIKALAKESFVLDLADYDFVSPTVTAFNPISGVSSGSISGTEITSVLHPMFVKSDGLLQQRYIGAFNAVNGRSICGAGVKAEASISRTNTRTKCRAFGTYFNQMDFFLRSGIVLLAYIERGSFFLERGGASLNNKWEGYSWRSGATSNDQDNGLTLSLGNKTGVVMNASNQTIANNYRGIENYHSALWQWVDGVNINNNKVYLSKVRQDAAVYDDTSLTSNDYFDSGLTVPSGMSASYIAEFHPGTIVPKSIGASATTKATDAGWSAGGLRVLAVGGLQDYPSICGLVTWYSAAEASTSHWIFVGRAAY